MPEDMTVLRIGTYIESNSSYVIDMKRGVLPNTSVVLCFLPHNKVHPFVVHSYMEDSGMTHTGEYRYTIQEAQEQFKLRLA